LFVKICGITRADDARMAVRLGAQALGFIFWPGSKRVVTAEQVREIITGLPRTVTTVGVFVNQPAEYIGEVLGLTGLTTVQLHGDETPAFASGMTRPVIKAIGLANGAAAEDWPENVMLLADAHDPVRRGGTGTTTDWGAAAAVASTRKLLLAGGLTPENVAAAIARVQPYGVDVSSGVERAPGVKDHDRLAALFDAIRTAESRTL
jgi:phosphoribosylanthranilate isomerase